MTIEAADIDARIKKAYKDFGKKYKFPGFRPGHVPRQIIDANLGKEAVLSTVTDEMLNETFPVAIDEADLILISEPKFSEVDGPRRRRAKISPSPLTVRVKSRSRAF